jgi:probable rRNA maturation factor
LIEIEIEDPAWTQALPNVEALSMAAAAAALKAPSVSFADRSPESGGASRRVVILLAGDAAVQELNARFRGQDKPTNVLAFPAAPNPEGHLGDVALGYGVCAREAARQGKPLAHHLQHLVAHGVLHLLGYDHMNDDEAQEMEGLERVVLAGLGVADPYAAGERDHD